MQIVSYNGWKNNARLANREVELIVTSEVGPRIIRFGFLGEENLFANVKGQQGTSGEKKWMIRGGHRFWIAPEEAVKTYELDNSPIRIEEIKNGLKTIQPAGPLSKIQKTIEITLSPKSNDVVIVHKLTNRGKKVVELAPWPVTAMGERGTVIIPLPAKVPHVERLTHNQEWSIWSYTDFTDPRLMLGSRYVFLKQDPKRGPAKLGIAHREGWVAYLRSGYLFVKRFGWKDGAAYPDGGVNFETFTNQYFIEIESLAPLVKLAPGRTVTHREDWSLHRNVPACKTETDMNKNILPIISRLMKKQTN